MSNKMLTIQKVQNNDRGPGKPERAALPSSSGGTSSTTAPQPLPLPNGAGGPIDPLKTPRDLDYSPFSCYEDSTLVEEAYARAGSFSGRNDEQLVKLGANTVRLVNPVGADHGVGGRLEGILYG